MFLQEVTRAKPSIGGWQPAGTHGSGFRGYGRESKVKGNAKGPVMLWDRMDRDPGLGWGTLFL